MAPRAGMSAAVLLLLQPLLSVSVAGDASCGALGCDGAGSNRFGSQLPKLSAGTVVFSKDVAHAGGLRCLSQGGQAVCAIETAPGFTSGGGLIATDAAGNTSWSYLPDTPVHYSALTYPVFDTSGTEVFSFDQDRLIGTFLSGTPRGEPLPVTLTGLPYSPVATQNQIVMLTVRTTGLVVGFLDNGITHASILLQDTVDGSDGVFVSVQKPALQGSTIYVMGQFVPDPPTPPAAAKTVNAPDACRLYSVVVQRTAVYRLNVTWNFPFEGSCAPGATSQLALLSDVYENNVLVFARSDGTVVACEDSGAACELLFDTAVEGAPAGVAVAPHLSVVENTAFLAWPGTPTAVMLMLDPADKAHPKVAPLAIERLLPDLSFTPGYRVSSASILPTAEGHHVFAHMTDAAGAPHIACLRVVKSTADAGVGFTASLAFRTPLPRAATAPAPQPDDEDRQMVLVAAGDGSFTLVVPGAGTLVGIKLA